MKFLFITDFRGWLWETFPNWKRAVSLDTSYIETYFIDKGHTVIISSYKDFDFHTNYSGYYVIYTSSEDYCGLTKDYIEDILLWLNYNGAILLPNFYYFRSHHNKVMMELMRKSFHEKQLKNIQTKVFRAQEDIVGTTFHYPAVLKAASGSGSKGVCLIHNERELMRMVKRVSITPSLKYFILIPFINFRRKIKKLAGYYCKYNKKFIIQEFIPNLDGDYKVLIFTNKYFVLRRKNRAKDFRASGSGIFADIDETLVFQLLKFARICKMNIHSPFISLDIGYDGKDFFLLEFQCVSFGFKAMSMSDFHYEEQNNEFVRVNGNVISEEVFCEAIINFIEHDRTRQENLR